MFTQIIVFIITNIIYNVYFQFFFDRGAYSSTIRNNIELFVLFPNHGNNNMNKLISERLGYSKRFLEAARTAYDKRHGYVIINCSSRVPNDRLRVCTSFYCENGFPALYN